MIKAVKKDTGSIVYMRLQKHTCPKCGRQLKVTKITKTVRAKTKEAANFDFTACDAPLGDKVKFIWYEFKCRDCKKLYTEAEIKAHEKKLRDEAKAEKREAAKAERTEKKAERQAARAEEKSAKAAERQAAKAKAEPADAETDKA